MRKKGFTLIELIAVIAILSVLAMIAVPRVIQYVEKSKKVAIQTEAKNLYDAINRAYNSGLIKPNRDNVYVERDSSGNPVSEESVKFDNMVVFENGYCQNNQPAIMDILEKDNIISKDIAEKDKERLGAAYYVGFLKEVINDDPNKIVLNKDGSLNNWYGNPIK